MDILHPFIHSESPLRRQQFHAGQTTRSSDFQVAHFLTSAVGIRIWNRYGRRKMRSRPVTLTGRPHHTATHERDIGRRRLHCCARHRPTGFHHDDFDSAQRILPITKQLHHHHRPHLGLELIVCGIKVAGRPRDLDPSTSVREGAFMIRLVWSASHSEATRRWWWWRRRPIYLWTSGDSDCNSISLLIRYWL